MTKLLLIPVTELSIFSIVFSGREKIERRNLRPACSLYLLVSLRVEPMLHEWQVYESGIDRFEEARTLFLENKGELLSNSPIQYETAEEMRARFLESMAKYRDYQTVIVVTHNMLMRQFVPNEKIDFCQVIECELEI